MKNDTFKHSPDVRFYNIANPNMHHKPNDPIRMTISDNSTSCNLTSKVVLATIHVDFKASRREVTSQQPISEGYFSFFFFVKNSITPNFLENQELFP